MGLREQEGIVEIILRFLSLRNKPRPLSQEELDDFGTMQEYASSAIWDELYGKPEQLTRVDLMMQIIDINEVLVALERSCATGFDWVVSTNVQKGVQISRREVSREDSEQAKMLLTMRLCSLRKRLAQMPDESQKC